MRLVKRPRLIFVVAVLSGLFSGRAQEATMPAAENRVAEGSEKGVHLRFMNIRGEFSKKGGYSKFHLDGVTDHLVDQSVLAEHKRDGDPGTWPTFDEANKSDDPKRRGVHSVILEYIISDHKSLFHVADGIMLSPSDEGALALSTTSFDTEADGIGYRIYDRSGKMLWSEFFGSPEDPQVTLESRPGGRFILHGSGLSTGIWVQWSQDHGKTWSDKMTHQLNMSDDYATTRIPKHVLAKNQEVMLEFDIMVGMKLFRKRFIYNGDGKPLKGNFSQRPLRKRWQPTAEHPDQPDGWRDYEEPAARPN